MVQSIDERVAKQVMRWTAQVVDIYGQPHLAWCDTEGRFKHHLLYWRPSSRLDQAWQVVAKLEADGMRFGIYTVLKDSLPQKRLEELGLSQGAKYSALFDDPTLDADDDSRDGYGVAHEMTAPLAICMAAVKFAADRQDPRT